MRLNELKNFIRKEVKKLNEAQFVPPIGRRQYAQDPEELHDDIIKKIEALTKK